MNVNLNLIDSIIIILLISGAILGVMMGALRLLISFTTFIALVTVLSIYPQFAGSFGTDTGAKLFLYLLLCFVALLIAGLLSRLINSALQVGGLGPLDRLIGVVLGLTLTAFLVGALVSLIENYGAVEMKSLLKQSQLADPAKQFFNQVVGFTRRLFPTQ